MATLLAQASGATPSAGAYDHYVHDHLGSTRGVYDASKALLSDFEYTPYGTQYAQAGGIALPELPAGIGTGGVYDPNAGMYLCRAGGIPERIFLGRRLGGIVEGKGNPRGGWWGMGNLGDFLFETLQTILLPETLFEWVHYSDRSEVLAQSPEGYAIQVYHQEMRVNLDQFLGCMNQCLTDWVPGFFGSMGIVGLEVLVAVNGGAVTMHVAVLAAGAWATLGYALTGALAGWYPATLFQCVGHCLAEAREYREIAEEDPVIILYPTLPWPLGWLLE